jgi:polysaccharide pyruvyl transferase WcaK-like protein
VIVEICGAGFYNMGAELMLLAARNELLSWDSVNDVAISFRTGTRHQKDQAGVAAVLRLNSARRPWANSIVTVMGKIAPEPIVRAARMYKPSGIDALVDASGFAFGDQWGPAPSRILGSIFGLYSGAGKPIALLPQAFGPFQNANVAEVAPRALDQADLIFARDPESLSHLRGLSLTKPAVRMAPDFTNLLEPAAEGPQHNDVIIIPNYRMVDMVESVSDQSYLAFLKACATVALDAKYRVRVIAHEVRDVDLAMRLRVDLGDAVMCEAATDPLRTKAIVGGAALVVSSRYHGLVNALSQCVPAVGTGWSHKYSHLFNEYGCPDGLWDVGQWSTGGETLGAWLTTEALASRRQALKAPSDRLKREARDMWSQIRSVLCP